ncbi:hypothetical protein IWQ56_003891, partial [Coemansia nantahalensis]
MGRAAAAKNKRQDKKTPVPTLNFTVKDHQSNLIPGTTAKADVVLYYQGAVPGISAVHMIVEAKLESKVADIDDLTLGQITDYAHHMWKAQPTRTFVPVLLAILKLAWTPVSRQPEGAVYDALAAKGVGDVPEVFDSGILCKDMFEYRLEYIILQDCGETLDEHLAKLHADDEDDDVIEAKLTRVIQRVSACLVRAWNAGIIHRDISTGNIAVHGDKVAVIDWGYAKVCEWAGLGSVAKRWDIDFDEICKVESENDKQTGTPIFMSIGLLFGRGKRD